MRGGGRRAGPAAGFRRPDRWHADPSWAHGTGWAACLRPAGRDTKSPGARHRERRGRERRAPDKTESAGPRHRALGPNTNSERVAARHKNEREWRPRHRERRDPTQRPPGSDTREHRGLTQRAPGERRCPTQRPPAATQRAPDTESAGPRHIDRWAPTQRAPEPAGARHRERRDPTKRARERWAPTRRTLGKNDSVELRSLAIKLHIYI